MCLTRGAWDLNIRNFTPATRQKSITITWNRMEERVVSEAFVTDTKSSTVTSEMDPQMEPVSLEIPVNQHGTIQELIKWQKWDQQRLL